MSTPQPVQPIQQPVIEDLRNALQMLQIGNGIWPANDASVCDLVRDIARLIRHALEQLSEPNLAAMQAGEILLKEWSGTPEPQCQLRDTIAGILNAQLTGEIPRTWNET